MNVEWFSSSVCTSISLISVLKTTCFSNVANQYHSCFISSLILFQPSHKLYNNQFFCLFPTLRLDVEIPTRPLVRRSVRIGGVYSPVGCCPHSPCEVEVALRSRAASLPVGAAGRPSCLETIHGQLLTSTAAKTQRERQHYTRLSPK